MSLEAQGTGSTAARLGPGALALVVGPSGAGKDALIAGARKLMTEDSRFMFPERVITRSPHGAEDHGSLSEADFAEAARQGCFAFTWQAHGLYYGVPASIDQAIRDGGTVIVNGSRTIGGTARQRYANVSLILVECPLNIRAARLALRGRESEAGIHARLARTVSAFDPAAVDVRINNSGSLADGVRALAAALTSLSR